LALIRRCEAWQLVDALQREFQKRGGLPFVPVLSPASHTEAKAEIKRPWKDRIFIPVTLWVIIGQVLNADKSCRAAVARLITHRAAEGCRRVARTRAAISR